MKKLSELPHLVGTVVAAVLLVAALPFAAHAGWRDSAEPTIPALSADTLTAPQISCTNGSEGLLNLSRYAVISWPVSGASAYRVFITAGGQTVRVSPDVVPAVGAATAEISLRAQLLETLLGSLLVGSPRVHVVAVEGTNWTSAASNTKTLDLSILGLLPPLAGGIRCGA